MTEQHEHGSHHDHDHQHARGRWWSRIGRVVHSHSHDALEPVDAELEASKEGIRALKISLSVLFATAVAQGVVVALTASTALLADTIHNFSDALTAVPLWVAFVIGRRPATRRYTYGFGRAEDLAGVFIVLMIAVSAVVAGYESVMRFVDGGEISYPWAVAAAGVLGFVGNEVVAHYRISVGRRIGSAALVADGLHARTDGFTSLAVVAGAAGVLLGYPLADPLVGLVITIAVLVVLRSAVVDVYRRLMDAVDPELTRAAEETVKGTPGVVAVEHLRLRWTGHRMFADVGVVAEGHLTLNEAHDIAHEAENRLIHQVPRLAAANVHVSPRTDTGPAI